MKQHSLFALLLIAIIATYAGFHLKRNMSVPPGMDELAGVCRPDVALNNLSGQSVPISSWDGKVVLLNFWAAWCPPCRREIPGFSEVREFYKEDGFEVVGIAIDDQESVENFLNDLKTIHYPQLIGEHDATVLAYKFGNKNGALPFSVLLDRTGTVRFIKYGELKKTVLIEKVEQLLDEPLAKPCYA